MPTKSNQTWVATAGTGGLSDALALARSDASLPIAKVFEHFPELNAGIQLGSHAVRLLQDWGVTGDSGLKAVYPENVQIRRSDDAVVLGELKLDEVARANYGAQYLTVNRADLHVALMAHVDTLGDVVQAPEIATPATSWVWPWSGARNDGENKGFALNELNAAREAAANECAPQTWSSVLTYRTIVPMSAMPIQWRKNDIGMWLGSNIQVVHYPISAGAMMSVTVTIDSEAPVNGVDIGSVVSPKLVSYSAIDCCAKLRHFISAVNAAGAEWVNWPTGTYRAGSQVGAQSRQPVDWVGDAGRLNHPYGIYGESIGFKETTLAQARFEHIRNTSRVRASHSFLH